MNRYIQLPMYNKIFTKILDSSIWLEPIPTRVVWLTLIAAMDEDGFAQFASVANLSHRARVSQKAAEEAIASLEGPDANSSDPENDGRRIERVPGGWVVLNAGKYRDLVTREISRQQTRARVAKHREKKAGNADVTAGNGRVTPSDSDTTSHSNAKSGSRALARKKRSPLSEQEFLDGLRSNPAYSKIDIDREIGKMRAWLSSHPDRKLTHNFALRWLNKVDVPLSAKGKRADGTCPIRPEDLPKIYYPKGADH